MKRLLGLVLFVFFITMSLGACASIERWCGHEAEKEKIVAQAKPEVKPAPTPPPPAPKPAPPKKDRG